MGWKQDDPKELGACHMSQDYLSIDPKAPWKSIRAQVEQEAKGLLLQKPQLSQLKAFFQRVPWHVFNLRRERYRSNLEPRDRKQGRRSAYVNFWDVHSWGS